MDGMFGGDQGKALVRAPPRTRGQGAEQAPAAGAASGSGGSGPACCAHRSPPHCLPHMQEASFKEFLNRPENQSLVEKQQRKEVKQAIQLQEKMRALEFRDKVRGEGLSGLPGAGGSERDIGGVATEQDGAGTQARECESQQPGPGNFFRRTPPCSSHPHLHRRLPSPSHPTAGRFWSLSWRRRRTSLPSWRTGCCAGSSRPSQTTPRATLESGPATRASSRC